MKKVLFLLAAAVLCASCEKAVFNDIEDEGGAEYPVYGKVKKFTFTLKGDFSDEWKPVTRAYLNADGKDLTDVWVLDYMDGNIVQQLHQSDNTAEDFGQPVMNLSYGTHHVYFIASRGTDAVLDTENHLIKFGKVLDTFYKDYEVSVVSTTNGNRAVTLDRIVTRLRLTFTDAISADAATINFAPHTWYYGWDYIAGEPADAKTDQTVTITIPDSEKGNTGVQANLFGFSTAAEWTTNVAINSKASSNTIIGQASITSAPFKANRITEYSG
ncbi:MAG: hypothetical protein UHJ41_05590, partial [Bacteroidaceae bacterium]|nr:hypothetical protein [Bacteroidaceae bacterium]